MHFYPEHHKIILELSNNQALCPWEVISDGLMMIASLVAIVGVCLAFHQYFSTRKNGRKQILKILRAQIGISEGWTMTKKMEERYAKKPSDEEMLDRADPFYVVYEIENTPALSTLSVKEISGFGADFIKALVSYNQVLQTIKNLQSARNQIAFSDIEVAGEIRKSINKIKNSGGSLSNLLSDENKDLSLNEKFIAKQLSAMNISLHWELIGCSGGRGLFEAQKELEDAIDVEETKLNRPWWQWEI